jgi:Holliday junction resolvase
MPKNKSKGSKAERELYEVFVKNNFRAVRVAGSGRMDNADCDLIAGKPGQKYAIEVKSTKNSSKYISKEQINSFIVFSEIFGLEPVIAMRFNRVGWFFLKPNYLEDAGKNYVINPETVRTKGKKFSQFFLKENVEKNNLENDFELIEDHEYLEIMTESDNINNIIKSD